MKDLFEMDVPARALTKPLIKTKSLLTGHKLL